MVTRSVGHQKRDGYRGKRSCLRHDIEPQDAVASREHMGRTFYFCSPIASAQFDADRTATLRQRWPPRRRRCRLAQHHRFNRLCRWPALTCRARTAARARWTCRRDGGARPARCPRATQTPARAWSRFEYDPQRTTTAALASGLRSAGFPGRRRADSHRHRDCAALVRGLHRRRSAGTRGVLGASVNVGTQEAPSHTCPSKPHWRN